MRGLSSLYRGLSGVEPTADEIGAVQKAGDTMTGALILSGSPTEPNQATTKSYVDSKVSPATTTTQGVVYRKSPTIQKFTSGSGTYTLPANVLYIKILAVGGGGGGSGSGTSGGGNGGNGGNTTFGTSLISANGGSGGIYSVVGGASGGVGGSASLGTGPIGTAITGGTGGGSSFNSLLSFFQIGIVGGQNALGGGGSSAPANQPGIAAITNTGGGGGGAGTNNATSNASGSGGGAGGYVDAIITSPSSTYSYAVGAAGTAGTGGANGYAGGTGGSGYIEITEYYN